MKSAVRIVYRPIPGEKNVAFVGLRPDGGAGDRSAALGDAAAPARDSRGGGPAGRLAENDGTVREASSIDAVVV